MSAAFIEACNGGVGSAVSKCSTYPLDLIKTRMAAGGGSAREVIAEVVKASGPMGLFQGLRPKLVKSVTGKFLYFYIYKALNDLYTDNIQPSVATENRQVVDTLFNILIGYFSEVFELPVIMPLEAVVSRVQNDKDNVGAVVLAKQMYREGGIGAFYVALDAYIVGALQPAIQFSFFDRIKAIMLKGQQELSAAQSFLLGVMASSLAVTVTYPIELARMIKQTTGNDTDSLLTILRKVVRAEGVLAMFKGLGPNLLQSVLSAAIMLMVKEKITRFTTRLLTALLKPKAAGKKGGGEEKGVVHSV